MTEQQWLASSSPGVMLAFLEGKVSERKLRLFACGCSRQNWDLLTDERSHQAVETGERYADGLASEVELAAARQEAREATRQAWDQPSRRIVVDEAEVCSFADPAYVARYPTRNSPGVPLPIQAALLRDITGSPCRPWNSQPCPECRGTGEYELLLVGNGTVPCPECGGTGWKDDWETELSLEDCLRWQDGVIPRLAQAIYEERAWDRMPILADALEEAGCNNKAILQHCRGTVLDYNDGGCAYWHTDVSGPQLTPEYAAQAHQHTRGCWVVDLVLGRK
jgi:hypothetical protein